jgi:outer membrane protein TolC
MLTWLIGPTRGSAANFIGVTWLLHLSGFLFLLLASIPAEAQENALDLPAALAEALVRHPAAGIGQSRLTQAEADYRAARAGLLPRLAANGYYNRLSPDRLNPGGAVTPSPLYAREFFVGLSARQLLYDGSTRAKGEAAQEAVTARQAGIDATTTDIVYQVTQSYYRVLEARALVQATRESLARALEFETLARVLFGAGKTTRLDLLKASSARLDTETALKRVNELETTAHAMLAAAIGRETPDFQVNGKLPDQIVAPLTEQTALAEALASNPGLRQLRHQIAQADLNLKVAGGARHPTATLQGGYGNRDRDIGGNANEWSAGVFLEMPLYDGGTIDAGIAKAEAVLVEWREAERAARIDLESQLRQALSSWRTAQADVTSTAERIGTGRESARAAEALYRAGKATALDVLTTQADLARAEADQSQALAAYAIARAAADRLLGKTPTGNGERP